MGLSVTYHTRLRSCARVEAHGGRHWIALFDDRTSVTGDLALFLPKDTPPEYYEQLAGVINAAIAAASVAQSEALEDEVA